MMPSPADHGQQLLAYLQAWRQYLEQTVGGMPATQHPPAAPRGMPAALPTPAAAGVHTPTPPTGYPQQLLAYLQAWRQYLEHATGVPAPGQSHVPPIAPPPPGQSYPPPVQPQVPPVAPLPPVQSYPPPVAPLPPVAPPPVAPPPSDWAPDAWPPADWPPIGRPPWPPTSQTSEILRPDHLHSAQFSRPHGPNHFEDEHFSHSESRYDLGRWGVLSEPVAEHQQNSAYVATHPANPVASAHAEPQSHYSAPAAPTAQGQEEKAVSGDRPEELELVKPLKDPSK
jgi:hypothetical protein